MLIKGFLFSFMAYFIEGRGAFLPISVDGHSSQEHFCEISLKWNHLPMRGCHLKVLLVLVLAGILLSTAELYFF